MNKTKDIFSSDSVYETVIGLEVHCQLNTSSKLFCACSTQFGREPNHNTCPVCLGLPGTLPVLNRNAVDAAIKLALAFGAEIRPTSVFARKQYFYPDLPKGYQITQYDLPYCFGGGLKLSDGSFVTLTRIHLEEDAGKNIHADRFSYIDLNRAGMPLLEIVSEPCIHNASQAADYLRRLRALVRHLDISDGNLEEGSFRCDVNVSIRKRGSKKLGTRCEIKNLNSFRNVEKAIHYEVLRQIDVLEDGLELRQQTLLYDPALGRTAPMRSKEEAQDYRYFPDPDLPPLKIDPDRILKIRSTMPLLPEAIARNYMQSYDLSAEDAEFIALDKDLSTFYEQLIHKCDAAVSPKIAANWLISEYLREVNTHGWDLKNPPINASAFAELLNMIADNTISGKIAKSVFEEMVKSGSPARKIVEEKGLVQVTDENAISVAVEEVLNRNPQQISEYIGGKEKIYSFFVGQLMQISKGKFNPALLNKILKEKLDAKRLS